MQWGLEKKCNRIMCIASDRLVLLGRLCLLPPSRRPRHWAGGPCFWWCRGIEVVAAAASRPRRATTATTAARDRPWARSPAFLGWIHFRGCSLGTPVLEGLGSFTQGRALHQSPCASVEVAMWALSSYLTLIFSYCARSSLPWQDRVHNRGPEMWTMEIPSTRYYFRAGCARQTTCTEHV